VYWASAKSATLLLRFYGGNVRRAHCLFHKAENQKKNVGISGQEEMDQNISKHHNMYSITRSEEHAEEAGKRAGSA